MGEAAAGHSATTTSQHSIQTLTVQSNARLRHRSRPTAVSSTWCPATAVCLRCTCHRTRAAAVRQCLAHRRRPAQSSAATIRLLSDWHPSVSAVRVNASVRCWSARVRTASADPLPVRPSCRVSIAGRGSQPPSGCVCTALQLHCTPSAATPSHSTALQLQQRSRLNRAAHLSFSVLRGDPAALHSASRDHRHHAARSSAASVPLSRIRSIRWIDQSNRIESNRTLHQPAPPASAIPRR